jgi:hypothetical protein
MSDDIMNLNIEKSRIPILTGAFICLSLIISFWLIPGPSIPVSPEDATDYPWSLVSPDKERNLEDAFQFLIRRQPWGEETAEPGTISQITWRLSGIVRVAGKRFALIEMKDELIRFAEGETLPDGEVLQKIGDTFVEIGTQENRRKIWLYEENQ